MNKTTILWQCPNCKGKPEFDEAGFVKHLTKTHKITATQGSKELTTHMRGKGFSLFVYNWKIGGLKFTQTIHTEKKKNP